MNNQAIKALEALNFWYERAGRHLSDAPQASSLSRGLPCYTAKKGVQYIRIGGMKVPSAILIDTNEAIVIERLQIDMLPAGHDQVRVINRVEKGIDLKRTALEWMLDPARSYPFLAALPTTRALGEHLALSEAPGTAYLVSPGDTQRFDIRQLRDYRTQILSLPNPSRWIKAAEVRNQIRCAPASLPHDQRQRLTKAWQKLAEEVPLDVALPVPGTMDFDILKTLMCNYQFLNLKETS